MNTSKFVIMLTSLVVMALLVGAVFLPVVSSSTNRTTTTIEENEEPGWLKFGYSATDNYNFNVEIDGDNLNVGGQTGELYDMMVLSTDVLTIVIDGDSIVAVSENGAVDLGTTASVVKTSSGLTVGDTTYSAPLWSYYPSATGKYAYFDHADLFTDDAPLSAWGNFAGVYAYSQFSYPDVGVVMDATVTDGVIEGAIWGTAPDTLDIQPFHPGDVIFNPIDLNPIDVDLKPIDLGGGDNQIMTADPVVGTRIGDLYYTFDNTSATVVGHSSSTDWSALTAIPETVTDGGVTYTVTKIGNGAFQNCTNLALTSLPSGLVEIEGAAFQRCTNLALTSLPSGITFIGLSAFQGCTNLALTSLPSGLTNIQSSSFQGCTNLALTSLPSGITAIYNGAFTDCTSLALTSLPSGLTTISNTAFARCTNLALTSLPSGLTSVGNYVFRDCTNIDRMVIYGDTSLGTNVFYDCTFEGLTVIGNITTTATTFTNSSITEVLNLSTTEITTTTGGLNAEEVRTDIEAVGFIAPLGIAHTEQTTIESPTADVINILPLVAGIGLLLIGLGVFITRRI